MITVSRLDGGTFVVNADQIELIETTPDTVLSLTSGRKLVVRETVEEVVERVVEYHQRIAYPWLEDAIPLAS